MELSILSNQLNVLKNNLITDIQSDLKKNTERIVFTENYYFVVKTDPEITYVISGVENGSVLIDNYFFGTNAMNLNDLPIEALIFVKTNLIYHKSSKVIDNNK